MKSILLSIYIFFLTAPLTYAQGGSGGGGAGGTGPDPQLINPITAQSIPEFLDSLLTLVTTKIAPPIIVLFLVYAGFLFVTAQGNDEKLESAKNVFKWTIIGAAILLGAELLSKAIIQTIINIRP